MAIDLDYMVRLKDGQVIEHEMVRGELRDVICSVVDEMNPDWFGCNMLMTDKNEKWYCCTIKYHWVSTELVKHFTIFYEI